MAGLGACVVLAGGVTCYPLGWVVVVPVEPRTVEPRTVLSGVLLEGVRQGASEGALRGGLN